MQEKVGHLNSVLLHYRFNAGLNLNKGPGKIHGDTFPALIKQNIDKKITAAAAKKIAKHRCYN